MENRKILVLRYGVNIIEGCIEKHKEVIEKYGYCWFGKIGRSPSEKVLKDVLAEAPGTVILYSRAGAYICQLEKISINKPQLGYPDYYETNIFNTGLQLSMYFKLKNIVDMNVSDLTNYIVSSSRNNLMDTLNKSMNSFFAVELRGSVSIREEVILKPTRKKKEVFGEKDCYYRKDEKCSNKSCVNYQYECLRPDMCLKQKR